MYLSLSGRPVLFPAHFIVALQRSWADSAITLGDLVNEHSIPIIYERLRVCHSNGRSVTNDDDDDDTENNGGDGEEDEDEDGDTCRRYVKPERLLSPRVVLCVEFDMPGT